MRTWVLFLLFFIVALNAGCAALQVYLVRRQRDRTRLLEAAICSWAALMSGLSVLQLFCPAPWTPFVRYWLYFPFAVEMIWNVLFVQFYFLALVMIVLFVRLRPAPEPIPAAEIRRSSGGMSRRQFLRLASYGALPAVTIGMGVHGTLTRDDLRVRDFSVAVAGLPPELEGFTIAHVSDLHSGLFVGPERLKNISAATNDLKADLVAITGDVINSGMHEFPAALAAINAIESRYGTYLCEGNHDRIPGEGVLVNACAQNHLPMLYNERIAIPVGGKRLILAGLPWMKRGFEDQPEIVSGLFPDRQAGDVRVLLAHHPHLFDIAESTDLVLAGHTHGGQIMAGPVGLGPVFFKYWSGPYYRGNTTMVVSNGCGDWFPCRIGAPAEIGLLRLTAAKAES